MSLPLPWNTLSLPWNKPSFFVGNFFLSFSKETSIVPFIALQYNKRTVFIHLNPKILARLTSEWVALEKLSKLKVWGLWEKEKGGKTYLWKKFTTEFSKQKKSWNKEFYVKAVWPCRWKDRWRRWRMTKMSTKSVIWPQKSHLLWQTDCFMRGRMIGLIICFAASNRNNLFCD